MASKNKTEVIIAGKIYTLSGYETEDYLQRVATYLNGKLSEFQHLEGYNRLSQELKAILLNLNIADDYFKTKKKVEELETELSERDKEIYDFKHELISAQIRIENMEKDLQKKEEEKAELQKNLIHLEASMKNGLKK